MVKRDQAMRDAAITRGPESQGSCTLLDTDAYTKHAERLLSPFEGVCSHAETRAVLAMRLRAQLERYIASRGGFAWGDLIALMCAFQHLTTVENAAADRKDGAT